MLVLGRHHIPNNPINSTFLHIDSNDQVTFLPGRLIRITMRVGHQIRSTATRQAGENIVRNPSGLGPQALHIAVYSVHPVSKKNGAVPLISLI
ncbi:hypothetical protein D3C76_1035360 [compost metagenome]